MRSERSEHFEQTFHRIVAITPLRGGPYGVFEGPGGLRLSTAKRSIRICRVVAPTGVRTARRFAPHQASLGYVHWVFSRAEATHPALESDHTVVDIIYFGHSALALALQARALTLHHMVGKSRYISATSKSWLNPLNRGLRTESICLSSQQT